MKNIFEKAKFGDCFLTRDGRKAVLISYNQRKSDTPYVCAIACYLDNSIKSVCHNFYANGQLHKHESNYDIVSEYQESIDEETLNALTEEYAEKVMYEHCEAHHISVPNHIIKDALRIGFKAGYLKALNDNECAKDQKQIIIDEACEIFADIINEVLPINASDMPYIKKFRKAMEDKQ